MGESSSELPIHSSERNELGAARELGTESSNQDESLLVYSSDDSGPYSDAYFSRSADPPYLLNHSSLTYSPMSSLNRNISSLPIDANIINKRGFDNVKRENYGSIPANVSRFSEDGSYLQNVTEQSGFRIPIVGVPNSTNYAHNKNGTLYQTEVYSTPSHVSASSYHHQQQQQQQLYFQNYHHTNNNNFMIASSTPPPASIHYKHSFSPNSSNDWSTERRILRRKYQEQKARENLVRQVRGTYQRKGDWKDVEWLIIFSFHFLLVLFCAVKYGRNSIFTPQSIETSDMSTGNSQNITNFDRSYSLPEIKIGMEIQLFHIDYQTALDVIIITGFFAFVLSTLTILSMLIFSRSLLQMALIFTFSSALGCGLIGLTTQSLHIISTIGFCTLSITFAYALWISERIPFAAINLYTALCGMRSSFSILLMGITLSLLAFGWFILWSIAFIGVVDNLCNLQACQSFIIYTILIISLCWTQLIIKNIVQVTVASSVSIWWFKGECHVKEVLGALGCSFTKSMGSICFGSMIMIPAQVIRALSCFNTLQSYNTWAYTYVGIYGYDFYEAGTLAKKLFEAREWETVVNDSLIHNVLMMCSIVIGGFTGTFGVLLEEVDGYELTSFHRPIFTSFLIGCTIGIMLSANLFLGLLNAAVNTILVCFAAGPIEFHENHPRLSQDLRDAWSQQVWEPTV